MSNHYPDDIPELTREPIDDETLANIGRLIRGCAEFEDCLTLFICGLCGISESHAAILLGKTAFTRRKQMAQYLSKSRDDEALDVFNKIYNGNLAKAFECRNSVAHGVYLGRAITSGEYYFMTQSALAPEDESTKVIVVAYGRSIFRSFADALEHYLPKVEAALNIRTLRERRHSTPLRAHPKARSQRSKSGIRERQPPPSQE